jgi:two-component system C4-dicarboxylate transport sensor histidine kinase DctB
MLLMPLMLRNALLTLFALLLMGLTGTGMYRYSFKAGTASLREASNARLDLFASVVEARVRRLEPIPATIQLNPLVVRVLLSPTAAHIHAANDYLARLNAHLGSAAVFVLDERGSVLATSNLTQPDDSLLGENVAYRPYYLEALAGRATRHFAMGSGGQAGYFASHPIHDGSRVLGVAVVKIGLDALEETWPMLAAPTLVADANQVVILSSHPNWRYTSLAPLPVERRVDLQLARTYGSLRLPQFPISVPLSVDEETQEAQGFVSGEVALNREVLGAKGNQAGHMVLGRSLDGMDWRVMDGVAGAVSAGFFIMLMLYWAQRRRIEKQKLVAKRLLEQANVDLEHQVSLRTQELTAANEQLRHEIVERKHTEQTLRAAQDELVHAGKMAILGQLAASITHELAQPLGGIRTLSGNAAEFMRRGNLSAAQDNLSIVARLVDQMAHIIQPLKSFSRKSSASPGATDVGRVLQQALFLYQLRLRQEDVRVENHCLPQQWLVWCDANRLEQVLINLIGNALDAMREAPERVLTLTAEVDESHQQPRHICLTVKDTGKGLSATDQQHLFEPFYTTKPNGVGLGLGLAICRDLVAEFKGELLAHNHPEGGACFVLRVPLM